MNFESNALVSDRVIIGSVGIKLRDVNVVKYNSKIFLSVLDKQTHNKNV